MVVCCMSLLAGIRSPGFCVRCWTRSECQPPQRCTAFESCDGSGVWGSRVEVRGTVIHRLIPSSLHPFAPSPLRPFTPSPLRPFTVHPPLLWLCAPKASTAWCTIHPGSCTCISAALCVVAVAVLSGCPSGEIGDLVARIADSGAARCRGSHYQLSRLTAFAR
jgi:hypothetical protein